MLLVIWPLLIAVIGVLMYALCSNPKLAEIGRIIFFCGFFFTVAVLAGKAFKI
jgi:Na+/phosphate symporter